MGPFDGRTDKGVAEDFEPKVCEFVTELTMLIPVITWLDWFETENVLASWLQTDCASELCIG